MQLTIESLASFDIDASQIHSEYFVPSEESSTIPLPQTNKEFLLHYYEQSNLLEVKPGMTILETALEDRIPVSYSCKNGTCGMCIGKQTAGKIYMRKNFALTEEQLKEGFVLLCQSFPIDDDVTVSVG